MKPMFSKDRIHRETWGRICNDEEYDQWRVVQKSGAIPVTNTHHLSTYQNTASATLP